MGNILRVKIIIIDVRKVENSNNLGKYLLENWWSIICKNSFEIKLF